MTEVGAGVWGRGKGGGSAESVYVLQLEIRRICEDMEDWNKIVYGNRWLLSNVIFAVQQL